MRANGDGAPCVQTAAPATRDGTSCVQASRARFAASESEDPARCVPACKPHAGEACSESMVRRVRRLCARATLAGSGRRSSRARQRTGHCASTPRQCESIRGRERSPKTRCGCSSPTRGGVLPERGLADVRASAECASKNVGVADLRCVTCSGTPLSRLHMLPR
jgi:hypothetical protein